VITAWAGRWCGVVLAAFVAIGTVLAGRPGWAYLALPLTAPLVIGLAADGSHTARLLSTPSMRYLGRISFALYMTHYLAIWTVRYLVSDDRLRATPPALGAVSLVVFTASLIAIADVAHRLVEVPARRTLTLRRATN